MGKRRKRKKKEKPNVIFRMPPFHLNKEYFPEHQLFQHRCGWINPNPVVVLKDPITMREDVMVGFWMMNCAGETRAHVLQSIYPNLQDILLHRSNFSACLRCLKKT